MNTGPAHTRAEITTPGGPLGPGVVERSVEAGGVQFSWESAERATHSIPGARFAAIDDAGHFPMVEKPEETSRLLSGFLDPEPPANLDIR